MSSATYNNTPERRAKTRIVYDVRKYDKERDIMAIEGLYFKFNMNNHTSGQVFSTKYSMLIVGPDDTPYEGGFYFFKAQFPDQYPFLPMKMKTMTQGENIRKHPNLYISGKCCFSFLGTWPGPPWTACQNPYTVGMSMRSVLTKNPIVNEPGWEKKNDERTKLYEELVIYFNLRWAVVNIMENLSRPLYYDFKTAIEENFIKNYPKYLKQLESIYHHNNKTIKSPVYRFTIELKLDYVKEKLGEIYNNLVPGSIKVTGSSIKTKKVRKSPKEKASRFEEGTVKIGLDKREWICKKYEGGMCRWILNKKKEVTSISL